MASSSSARRSLPARPSLRYLREEAKDLLRAHRRTDATACDVLRNLPRFADATDGDIFAADLALANVQHALALAYGFATWTELARHVEVLAKLDPHPFCYEGVGADDKTHTGTVRAVDFGGALIAVRKLGLFPTRIRREDMTSEEMAEIRRIDEDPRSSALKVVELTLLQGYRDAVTRVEFDCTGNPLRERMWIENQSSSFFDWESHPGDLALAALQEMADQPTLGIATAMARRTVHIGRMLPDEFSNVRLRLRFSSDAARPGLVMVAFEYMGEGGCVEADAAHIVQHVTDELARGRCVHVLTRTAVQAKTYAALLRKHGAVRLPEKADALPDAQVVVSPATEFAFLMLRAETAGASLRRRAWARIGAAHAVAVGLDDGFLRTPCRLHETDALPGFEQRPATLLMHYTTVTGYALRELPGPVEDFRRAVEVLETSRPADVLRKRDVARNLGPLLRAAREHLGWSVHQLAKNVDCNMRPIIRLEKGQELPTGTMLRRLLFTLDTHSGRAPSGHDASTQSP